MSDPGKNFLENEPGDLGIGQRMEAQGIPLIMLLAWKKSAL